MQQRKITDDEVKSQSVYSTASWSVLLPKRPINSYHFMILANRNEALEFTTLNDEELSELKSIIKLLTESIEHDGVSLNGYNLFSNNGTYEIGQHISRFHQHIFLRIKNEIESPYDLMANNRRWSVIGSKEWDDRLNELRSILNS